MSYGSILGQVPSVDLPDLIASNVTFNPVSVQPTVTGNNVQTALEQTINYAEQTNILSQALQNYNLIGYIENYLYNVELNRNTLTKVTAPWTKKPNTTPDLIVVACMPYDEPIELTTFLGENESAVYACGPDIENIFGANCGICLGTQLTAHPSLQTTFNYGTPNFTSGNFKTLNLTFKLRNDIKDVSPSRYSDLFNSIYYTSSSKTITADFYHDVCNATGDETKTYYFGAFNWDLNNFYYYLYFNLSSSLSAYSEVSLNVFALKKKK